jgi:hypothetical protein
VTEVDVERLLRSALAPVDPPVRLSERLETALTEIADAAAEELADWELSAMRDPRNWGRPAAAAAAGAAAGGALIILRARRRQRQRNAGRWSALERELREFAEETRRRFER